MSHKRIRVVVGEGQSARKGLLRFVLEGDGHEVVAEATGSPELAKALAAHKPDVAVLDDGIGVAAAQMVREISPETKVVLVWPGAVVPIGGDARVEPSEVLRSLGPTVARVAGRPAPITTTFQRPDWIDKVRKDPATLREMLERRAAPPKRPSVTELQKRGQRLHPTPSDEAAEAAIPPILILPEGAGGKEPGEPIVVLPGASSGAEPGSPEAPGDETTDRGAADQEPTAPVVPISEAPTAVAAASAATTLQRAAAARGRRDPEATEWNRKLGTIALGGAAVAGALVLALALGGSRVPTMIGAEAPVTPSVGPSVPGNDGNTNPDGGPDGGPGQQPGGPGQQSGGPGEQPGGPIGPQLGGGDQHPGGTGQGEPDGGGGGNGGPDGGGGNGGPDGGGNGGPDGGGNGGPDGGGGNGGPDGGDGGNGGPDGGGGNGGPDGGDGGNGGPDGGDGETRTFGKSAQHNPFGTPPGHTTEVPGNSGGNGGAVGGGGGHGDDDDGAPGHSGSAPGHTGDAPPAHSHAGGNGNGNGHGHFQKVAAAQHQHKS